MALTFGIHIGHMGGPLDEMRKLWRFADEMGFDWFSVSDHFQESPPQGGGLPCFEGVTTLTAAALETRRVLLGSLVFCLGYRTPGLLAKSLTTIDHLSGGRVNCGIGAGWHAIEFQAYGIPFPPIGVREDQLEEYAQILRLLFDPAVERAQFEGHHFRLEDAPNIPKPLQRRLPIWIGGQGEKRTLRAVARYADGWNAPYISPDVWSEKSHVLDRWCERERRDPRAIARTVNVGFYVGADARAAARHEAVFQQHWKNDPRRGFLRGTPKDTVELIGAYRDAGVERMNIAFRQGPYDWEALQAFVETVFPAFGITRPE
jgi:alkanesulfonate monooxygenase SsuD/methylene tetrahydromethanopterin reductase-like flavin-dependent oxidoreductase (luciferase family)